MTIHHIQAGDVVVVTGGAQGFGRAIAVRLAKMGARVAVWDIDRAGAEATASLCAKSCEARVFEVDLGNRAQLEKAVSDTRAMGAPFGLVNNAAIFPRSPILELKFEEWNRVLAINLTGAFLTAQAFAPMMVTNGRGCIVNISSGVAFRGDTEGAHYSAAKAALISLTKSFALALGPKQIRVNCIIPGIADTAQPLGAMSHEELVARGKNIPLGRIGQPNDIAGVVAFLMGEDAAYVNGQSIGVNGGGLMLP